METCQYRRTWTINAFVVFGILVTGLRVSEARRRSPTEPPPVKITVGGLVGHSVNLQCHLSKSSPPNVQWFDEVHNDGEEPMMIYSSLVAVNEYEELNNMDVDSKHPNKHNFDIGEDYSLTISHLDIVRDPGNYFCRSTLEDGTQLQRNYQLTIIGAPNCSGETKYQSGHHMNLDCVLGYSGPIRPTVDWFRTPVIGHRHHRRDVRHKAHELINSVDAYDFEKSPIARKIVKNPAHPIDDDATYRCMVSVGNLTKECHLKLSVEYLVQNLRIHPGDSNIFVGDTVSCSAEGNPTPDIVLEPRVDDSKNGWRSFRVGREYIGKDLIVSCTATNSLNGTTEKLSGTHTFHVSERPVPTEPTPAPTPEPTVHHGHHEHNHHHSHPPKKEEQPRRKAEEPTVQKSTRGAASQTVNALLTLVLSALIACLVLN